MRRRAEAAAERARAEAQVLEGRERVLFGSLILVAGVTVGVAVSGVILIFSGGLTVGIVSGAIGLLTGAGTIILRNMTKELNGRKQKLLEHEREDSQLLAAIGVALLIPDPDKQNNALAELAATMVARVSPKH
jgi:hypothetical protein